MKFINAGLFCTTPQLEILHIKSLISTEPWRGNCLHWLEFWAYVSEYLDMTFLFQYGGPKSIFGRVLGQDTAPQKCVEQEYRIDLERNVRI